MNLPKFWVGADRSDNMYTYNNNRKEKDSVWEGVGGFGRDKIQHKGRFSESDIFSNSLIIIMSPFLFTNPIPKLTLTLKP